MTEIQITKEKFNLREWNAEYYKNNKEDIINRHKEWRENNKELYNCRACLKKLNVGIVAKPTKASIIKYQLYKVFDEDADKLIWASKIYN